MRSIACPNLELIHIFNAFYGKLNGNDCNTPISATNGGVRNDIATTCFSRNAPSLIKETCHGQQSCDLYAEDALYDDPCPNIDKYLFVSFTCQGKSQLKSKLQDLLQDQQQQQKPKLQEQGLNFARPAFALPQQFVQPPQQPQQQQQQQQQHPLTQQRNGTYTE